MSNIGTIALFVGVAIAGVIVWETDGLLGSN